MPSKEISEMRDKIVDWLKEDGFSVSERSDPNAIFNIEATRNNFGVNVVNNALSKDSVFIGARIALIPEQQAVLRKMDNQKKQDFLMILSDLFLRNNELGDFGAQPKPLDDIQTIFVSSRRIYFEELSKSKLLTIVNIVIRNTILAIGVLQKTTGVISPKAITKAQDYTS